MTIYLDAALAYAAKGFHVFPTRITKAPYTSHGVKDATTDAEQIKCWWTQWPNAGIGLRCGQLSGVWALDIDPQHGGNLSLDDLQREHGTLPDTLRSRTGGGGEHRFFKYPGKRVRNSVSSIGAGLDCRGDDGYVILPPSRHESGGSYSWLSFDDAEIDEAPEWLLSAVCQSSEPARGDSENDLALPPNVRHPPSYIRAALAKAASEIANAPPKTSNDLLNKTAFSFQRFIKAGWVRRDTVEDALFQAAESRGTNPASVIRKTIASGLGSATEPATAAPPTAVAERSGEDAKQPEQGAVVLPSSAPMRLAEWFRDQQKDALGRLMLRRWRNMWWRYKDGSYSELPPERLRSELWAALDRVFVPDKNRDPKRLDPKSATLSNVEDALLGCGVLIPDRVDPPAHLGKTEAFRDIETAVTSNGLLDLQTGSVSGLTPEMFATSRLGVAWPTDSEPRPPQPTEWLKFLNDVWGDDPESIDLLQEWFGYCLTPDTSQQKMLMLLGPPRSGKGTMVYILTEIMGEENVLGCKLSDLSTPYGLQPWLDKPLVVIPDARLGGRADRDTIVETLLCVSGEDRLTVPRKYVAAVTCRLPARIMLLSNQAPRLSDASGALASRFLMLRTKKSFADKEDTELRSKLVYELPSILGWAMDGWRRLHARGRFLQSEASKQQMKEFAFYGSPVKAFVEDCCIVKPGAEVTKTRLFERWSEWCHTQGNERGTMGNFTINLLGGAQGVEVHARRGSRSAYFSGLEIDPDVC